MKVGRKNIINFEVGEELVLLGPPQLLNVCKKVASCVYVLTIHQLKDKVCNFPHAQYTKYKLRVYMYTLGRVQ